MGGERGGAGCLLGSFSTSQCGGEVRGGEGRGGEGCCRWGGGVECSQGSSNIPLMNNS